MSNVLKMDSNRIQMELMFFFKQSKGSKELEFSLKMLLQNLYFKDNLIIIYSPDNLTYPTQEEEENHLLSYHKKEGYVDLC